MSLYATQQEPYKERDSSILLPGFAKGLVAVKNKAVFA